MQKAARDCARNGLWARGTPRVSYDPNIPPGIAKSQVPGRTGSILICLLTTIRDGLQSHAKADQFRRQIAEARN